MKKKNIIKILILIVSLITIIGITFLLLNIFNNDKKEKKEKKPETNIKINTNEDVVKDQIVDGNIMRNTSLIVEDGITYLVVDVTNNTDEDYTLNEYMINVKDAGGNVIVRIPGYVGEVIHVGDTKTIKSMVNMDLSEAASIDYEVVK